VKNPMNPLHLSTISFTTVLTLGAMATTSLPRSSAAPVLSQAPIQSTIRYNPPPPPPNQGEPGDRGQGGAQRGCEVTALVPITKTNDRSLAWGTTTRDRPTFWLHLQRPNNITTNLNLQLELKALNQPQHSSHTSNFTLEEVPAGIISFTPNNTVPPLEVNQTYHWSLKVYCNQDEQFVRTQGTIRRVALSAETQKQLNGKTPLEQASVYARQGIWFEALTTLGTEIRNSQDEGAIATWQSLLKQANLQRSATAPITACCTTNQSAASSTTIRQ
jgi:hypothetical protein